MVKYLLWVQKLLYYTIQHEGGLYIDFREMSLRGKLRLTTAKRLSAYVVESASDDYNF